jgi:hypothetical protein
VIQTDERCFNRKVEYEYSNVRLIVMKIENPDQDKKVLTYKNGKMGWMRDTWEEYENLEPGEYYMYVEFDWPEKQDHNEFCVSYYGSATSYFLRDESSQFKKDELLAQLMASCAEQGLSEQKVTTYADQGAPNLTKYFGMTEEGYGYVHITNNEVEAEFTEVVNYTKFDRLSLLKPFKGAGYSVVVKPGEKRTIVIR